MSDAPIPTPGQRAWTIYTRVDPLTFWEEWDKLHAEQRRAWEAVAAALLAPQALRREETPMPNDPAAAAWPMEPVPFSNPLGPAFAYIEASGDQAEARVRAWCRGVLPRPGQRFALVCTGVVQTPESVSVSFQLAPLTETP